MIKTKRRNIIFYSLYEFHGEPKGNQYPKKVTAIIEYIKNHTKLQRRMNIGTDKFCLMESAAFNKSGSYYEILFKSAKHSFSPPLINRKTAIERANPKELDEGEVQKVHMVLKIEDDDVIVCMEKSRDGISINNLVDYLNLYMRKILKENDLEEKFFYRADLIAKDNFIELLKDMKRVSLTEVYYDKKILGSGFLDLSDRAVGIKNSILISIKPNWGETIKELAIDAFNKFNSSKREAINKIRIRGTNNVGGDVVLNTDFIEKRETIDVEYDLATGETSSKDTFRKLITHCSPYGNRTFNYRF